jgi:hypothetical protein
VFQVLHVACGKGPIFVLGDCIPELFRMQFSLRPCPHGATCDKPLAIREMSRKLKINVTPTVQAFVSQKVAVIASKIVC